MSEREQAAAQDAATRAAQVAKDRRLRIHVLVLDRLEHRDENSIRGTGKRQRDGHGHCVPGAIRAP
jgi:hypothetical protein